MKIKSITDIITNSSSEVFCYKINQGYEDLKKAIPEMKFTEFRTFEDIKKFVTSEVYCDWYFSGYDTQCLEGEDYIPEPDHDFYNYNYEEFIERLKKSGKTDSEIWDFLKEGYENVLGYAFLYLGEGSRDTPWRDKYEDWKHSKYMDKLKTYLTSNFKSGDILSVKEKFGNFKKPFLIKYYGGLNVENPYSSEIDKEDFEKDDLVKTIINCLDYVTATKATEEEIIEYNKFYNK